MVLRENFVVNNEHKRMFASRASWLKAAFNYIVYMTGFLKTVSILRTKSPFGFHDS